MQVLSAWMNIQFPLLCLFNTHSKQWRIPLSSMNWGIEGSQTSSRAIPWASIISRISSGNRITVLSADPARQHSPHIIHSKPIETSCLAISLILSLSAMDFLISRSLTASNILNLIILFQYRRFTDKVNT